MPVPSAHGFQWPVFSKQGRFLAVVVYEDEATFLRAESICSGLIKEFHDAEFDCLWVAFQGLENGELAKDAAVNAAKADLVIFSAHAGRELPDSVKQWIESWLPNKNLEETALAALVGLPTDDQRGITPIHVYLQDVAERGHMDFLPQIIATDQPPVFSQNEVSEPSQIKPVNFLELPAIPRHWGINE